MFAVYCHYSSKSSTSTNRKKLESETRSLVQEHNVSTNNQLNWNSNKHNPVPSTVLTTLNFHWRRHWRRHWQNDRKQLSCQSLSLSLLFCHPALHYRLDGQYDVPYLISSNVQLIVNSILRIMESTKIWSHVMAVQNTSTESILWFLNTQTFAGGLNRLDKK